MVFHNLKKKKEYCTQDDILCMQQNSHSLHALLGSSLSVQVPLSLSRLSVPLGLQLFLSLLLLLLLLSVRNLVFYLGVEGNH